MKSVTFVTVKDHCELTQKQINFTKKPICGFNLGDQMNRLLKLQFVATLRN